MKGPERQEFTQANTVNIWNPRERQQCGIAASRCHKRLKKFRLIGTFSTACGQGQRRELCRNGGRIARW